MNDKCVILSSYYDNLGNIKYPNEPTKGFFQKWGDTIRQENDKYFALTVAIVLGEDGVIYVAPPESITLIKEERINTDFVFNVPLEETMEFELLHPRKLRMSISEKRELRAAGAEFIYLVNKATGDLIGETYYIDLDTLLNFENRKDIPKGAEEYKERNAVYCYSNTILEKYQDKRLGKVLKAYLLGYITAKGYDYSIGHARQPKSIQLNLSLGAEYIRSYDDWFESGETYDFYSQKLNTCH
jgi:hypothetical protein